MAEPFLGEIRIVGFNFPPRGWSTCQGQLLQISQFSALFSILGTTYGGDGRTTFGLPNMQGRAPLHRGQGAGLSNRNLGAKGGAEFHQLTPGNLPSHSHTVMGTHGNATADHVEGALPAVSEADAYGGAGNVNMRSSALSTHPGNSQPHENMQPYIALHFVIALTGVFPSRN